MRSRFLILSLFAIATPVLADDGVTATAKPVKERRVCRRQANLGTNIPHSTCHTSAEWAEIDRINREAAQQTIANGREGGH